MTDGNGQRTAELLSRLVLTRDEVAELLGGVPAESVDYLHRTRQLPACKIGKGLRWKPADVVAFVEKLKHVGEQQ